MKIIRLVFLIMLITNSSFGQSVWKPWVVAEAGPVWGSNGPGGDARLQAGMRANGWLVGIGASYDDYRFKTVPIYVQGRKMFTAKPIRPFVLASFGINVEVEKDDDLVSTGQPIWGRWNAPSYQYSNGIYAEGGLGAAFRANRRIGLNLSLSYVYKTNSEKYFGYYWTGTNTMESPVENKYMMNRLALRLGIQF